MCNVVQWIGERREYNKYRRGKKKTLRVKLNCFLIARRPFVCSCLFLVLVNKTYRYLVTCTNCFSIWQEVCVLPSNRADGVSSKFYFMRFAFKNVHTGCPEMNRTDFNSYNSIIIIVN